MLKSATLEFRLTLIRRSVCLFFFLGILLSFKLWISNRFFPLAPVANFFSGLKSPFDIVLVCAMLLTLLLGIFFSHRIIFSGMLVVLLVLALQDQNRWQAWVFIYALICFPFTFRIKDEKTQAAVLNYLQIIFVGVYIWSGIHKLNPDFIDSTFHSILTRFFRIGDASVIAKVKNFGYIIPVIEIFIGVSFLIPRFRKMGVWLALITHVFVLLFLSPFGINSNSVVYPWNVAMIVFVFALFYKTENKIVVWQNEQLRMKIMTAAVVLLTWILPSLNFFGCWDNYLSFSLYSDKLHGFYILISEDELEKVDPRFSNYISQVNNLSVINVTSWSLGEMNSPIYPETRVFKQVCRALCKNGMNGKDVYFYEYEKPLSAHKYQDFSCADFLK